MKLEQRLPEPKRGSKVTCDGYRIDCCRLAIVASASCRTAREAIGLTSSPSPARASDTFAMVSPLAAATASCSTSIRRTEHSMGRSLVEPRAQKAGRRNVSTE